MCATNHIQRPIFRASDHASDDFGGDAVAAFLLLFGSLVDENIELLHEKRNERQAEVSEEALTEIVEHPSRFPRSLTLNMRKR